MSERHTIKTTHIQFLIKNALHLAEAVDGEQGSVITGQPEGNYEAPLHDAAITLPVQVHANGFALPEHILCKAVSDLRHAADELDAERLACYGWRQV